MGDNDAWTGPWASPRLMERKDVTAVKSLSNSRLQVARKDYGDCIVGTMSVDRLTGDVLRTFLEEDPKPIFVANIRTAAIVTGDAIDLAKSLQVGLGGFGDLQRALSQATLSTYVDPETQFITRALSQHTKVSNYVQLDDRRFRIERKGLGDVVVLFLNDYELSAEHVRDAIASYGAFDAIVDKNPNSEPSKGAFAAVAHTGIELIGTWSSFLGELNKRWT